MNLKQPSFSSIESAIAKLGYPGIIWFRGHTAAHRLIPALFRFPHGAKKESQIVELYECHSPNKNEKSTAYGLMTLLEMHHNYFPTRLLAWTESLHVALFCALVRESNNPTLFILDPVALNAFSKIDGIRKLDSFIPIGSNLSCLISQSAQYEYPIAIDGDITKNKIVGTENIFTFHGTDERSLEEQCPNCVIKVILTEEEKSYAENGILSGMWL